MEPGRRILVTGATGQVGLPVASALAENHEVVAAARFTQPENRSVLEAAGVRCVPFDLATGDLTDVPSDVDHVVHFGVVKSQRWETDLRANAEGVGLLMAHCASARSFLHCSTTGVYEPAGQRVLTETAPLGDNHRVMMPTYSITKIAAEAVVRTMARHLGLPTTIARLNVPYGDEGGWPAFHLEMLLAGHAIPVHPDRPNLFNPIHHDDIVAMVPKLLDVATVPATIVNWGGDEQVALEDWVAELGRLVGRHVEFVETEDTIGGVTVDLTKLHELVGHASVDWRDGMRRMVESLHPELLAGKR